MRLIDVQQRAQERRERALELRKQGKTFREVGEIMGVSAGVARICVIAAERNAKRRDAVKRLWWSGLSRRTAIGLISHAGCHCREDVEKLTERELLRVPNLGKRSIAELRLWQEGQLPSDPYEADAAITAKAEELELARKGISKQDDLRRKLKRLDAERARIGQIDAERERILQQLEALS